MREYRLPQGELAHCRTTLFVDCLLCRRCGHDIVPAEAIFNEPNDAALRQRNDTILNKDGVLIQLFKNPSGMCAYNLNLLSNTSELHINAQLQARCITKLDIILYIMTHHFVGQHFEIITARLADIKKSEQVGLITKSSFNNNTIKQ